VKHYGDITKIKGSEVPPVDIVCGGSPCQDLSVAGARKGLAGERSGLFMEQIRVIKEINEYVAEQLSMRRSDELVGFRPVRYMVWENVPGALSSGTPKSEDFRIVLEETAKIADKNATIPRPTNGKWTPSGCIMADRWSIAYRVHDAQFWGVTITSIDGRVVKKGTPQRRKRISLVADFRGQSAPKILFESKSLSGDFEKSREAGEVTSTNSERSVDPSSYTLKIRGGVDRDSNGRKAGKGALIQTELSGTLGVSQDQTLITSNPETVCIEGNGIRESHRGDGYKESDTMYTLNTVEQHGVCYEEPMLLESSQDHATVQTDGVSTTLPASMGMGGGYVPMVVEKEECIGIDAYNQATTGDKSKSLNSAATDSDHIPCVCYGLDRASFNQGENAKFDISIQEDIAQPIVARGPGGGNADKVNALCARDWKGVGNQYVSDGKLIIQRI
jgi:site-specific DNA-cytosine methylase